MRLGVISRLSLTRKGLCALLASSRTVRSSWTFPAFRRISMSCARRKRRFCFITPTAAVPISKPSPGCGISRPKSESCSFSTRRMRNWSFRRFGRGSGCVSNTSDLETLLKAIGAVGRGELWVSRQRASRLIARLAQAQPPDGLTSNGLTPQEWKVLGLLASGSRNKDIANRLSVSENTVKTHLYTIYRKVNVDCRLAATLYYFQRVKSDGNPSQTSSESQANPKKKGTPPVRGDDSLRS